MLTPTPSGRWHVDHGLCRRPPPLTMSAPPPCWSAAACSTWSWAVHWLPRSRCAPPPGTAQRRGHLPGDRTDGRAQVIWRTPNGRRTNRCSGTSATGRTCRRSGRGRSRGPGPERHPGAVLHRCPGSQQCRAERVAGVPAPGARTPRHRPGAHGELLVQEVPEETDGAHGDIGDVGASGARRGRRTTAAACCGQLADYRLNASSGEKSAHAQ